MSVYMLDMTGS